MAKYNVVMPLNSGVAVWQPTQRFPWIDVKVKNLEPVNLVKAHAWVGNSLSIFYNLEMEVTDIQPVGKVQSYLVSGNFLESPDDSIVLNLFGRFLLNENGFNASVEDSKKYLSKGIPIRLFCPSGNLLQRVFRVFCVQDIIREEEQIVSRLSLTSNVETDDLVLIPSEDTLYYCASKSRDTRL